METALYDRVKSLCQRDGITITELERILGFSKSTIGKWDDGRRSPYSDNIVKIAQYFHVSTDYLLGLSDTQQTTDEMLSNPDMIAIQRARERLSPADNKMMMDILRAGFKEAFKED